MYITGQTITCLALAVAAALGALCPLEPAYPRDSGPLYIMSLIAYAVPSSGLHEDPRAFVQR